MDYTVAADELYGTALDIHGVYRTTLPAGGLYQGHKARPTEKAALLFALEGEAEFLFNGEQRVCLTPGKAFLGGFGMNLEIAVGAADFRYQLVHYLPKGEAASAVSHIRFVYELAPGLDVPTMEKLDRLLQIAVGEEPLERLERQSLFYSLLSSALSGERNRLHLESYPLIEQARAYLHEHYAEPQTLESVSSRFGMKPKYFSHLFQKYTGSGPMRYLLRYRMDRAYERLITGSLTVREVARSVGYGDAYHFSRLFKQVKGVPPREVKMRGGGNSSL